LRPKQEKVEEDRYMRAQEEAWKEKLRKLKAEEMHMREDALHAEVVKPVMEDVSKMLAKTGDSVSDEALENLTKWKLGL
jgi:gas vesicle protein